MGSEVLCPCIYQSSYLLPMDLGLEVAIPGWTATTYHWSTIGPNDRTRTTAVIGRGSICRHSASCHVTRLQSFLPLQTHPDPVDARETEPGEKRPDIEIQPQRYPPCSYLLCPLFQLPSGGESCPMLRREHGVGQGKHPRRYSRQVDDKGQQPRKEE